MSFFTGNEFSVDGLKDMLCYWDIHKEPLKKESNDTRLTRFAYTDFMELLTVLSKKYKLEYYFKEDRDNVS